MHKLIFKVSEWYKYDYVVFVVLGLHKLTRNNVIMYCILPTLFIYYFMSHLCLTVQAGGGINKCFLEGKMTPPACVL